MQWVWILVGLMLLLLSVLLTWLLRRRSTCACCRIPFSPAVITLLRRTVRLTVNTQDICTLRDHALQLLEQLLRLRHALSSAPALPASTDGEPRMMEIARETADAGTCSNQTLIDALNSCGLEVTPAEVSQFSACITAAQCQRLHLVLKTIFSDAQTRIRAEKLAMRLPRSKSPYQLLEKASLNSIGLAALAKALRQQEQSEALVLLERWLSVHDITAETLAKQDDQRQLQLAEEIRQINSCFSVLEHLSWENHCEQADKLHPLLMKDPAGVYPSMDARSRLLLRLQAEDFSRHIHMETAGVVRQMLLLSEDAEPRTMERYAGYWLQNAEGCRLLHRALPTNKGRLHTILMSRRSALRYAILWIIGIFAGFCFLQSGQPVFMLPFFAIVTGDVIRLAVSRLKDPPLPRLAFDAIPAHVRTLVVLPALLTSQHDAIRMVRKLIIASHAFPQRNIEYLLLGDFTPAMTAVSSLDAAIIQAASSAAAAAANKLPIHYIQRGRVWDRDHHTYCAPGGRNGAVTDLCRLIAQGECESVIASSSLEPSALERRFDYVYILDHQHPATPGLLQLLLQTITHPLCSRYPTEHGWHGHAVISPGGSSVFEGFGLLQPDTYLEATDGLISPLHDANALSGELAGHISIPYAPVPSQPSPDSFDAALHHARCTWQMLPWQLPWVKTPSGVINNPLPGKGRFHLREEFRRALMPLCQYILLLWSVVTQNWLLLLLSLIVPELRAFTAYQDTPLKAACRFCLLPSRMLLPLLPLWDQLHSNRSRSSMSTTVEVWTQGLSATLYAALGILLPAFAIPAMILSVAFACFPLAHHVLDTPVADDHSLSQEHYRLLDDIAESTWRFFCSHTDAHQPCPPAFVQFEPGPITAQYTSPEAIGAYLLSCICARDLGYLSAPAATARIRKTLSVLQELPLPFGLPCQQYDLSSLTVVDTQVDAAAVGFFAASLMTVAQALRTWLPELPPSCSEASAEAESILSRLDLSVLYHTSSGMFHAGLDEHGQPYGCIRCLADDGLLLIIAACARKLVPTDCLRRLSRTHVRCKKYTILLSRYGTASEHLLPGLFIPLDESDASAFVSAMVKQGQGRLFGQSTCSVWRFDANLRYQQSAFGITGAAQHPVNSAPVFAAYAAALALPVQPRTAAEALTHFCELGLKGPEGLCDAVDFSNSVTSIGLHDAFHQGIILASAAHCLADSSIQQYFCSLPEVEACLPLLRAESAPFTLPAMPSNCCIPFIDSKNDHSADTNVMPAQMHLLGNEDFHLLADAHGSFIMQDTDIPLNTALYLYLRDEGRTYRLGDPRLFGTVTFTAGEARYEQVCGSLRSEMVCIADTLRRRSLHIITITNLSTRDRIIEFADYLLPALNAPQNTLEAVSPGPGRLTLHARTKEYNLHHTLNASITALQSTSYTDTDGFIGRGGSSHRPDALETPIRDADASGFTSCLAFRSRYAIGGRGQITLWLTTSLNETEPPSIAELAGIRQLAAMQHSAINASAVLSWQQREASCLLIAPLCHAGWELSFLADDPSAGSLTDLLAILGWMKLHGQHAMLHIHCGPKQRETLEAVLCASLAEDLADFADADTAVSSLALLASQPLADQLTALYSAVTFSASVTKSPIPANLPAMKLTHAGLYGGFDPETNDYILQLPPGLHPPAPWTNFHCTRHYREQSDERGIHAPFEEQIWIRMEDGTLLSPWSSGLPRAIRMRPAETDWETWSDQLDLRLRAACLPEHRCGLRTLHIHNASNTPVTLHIAVSADFDAAPLICTSGIVMTDHSDDRMQSFLAGDGWQSRRIIFSDSVNEIPGFDQPDSDNGRTAVISCEITLDPRSSGKAVWLSGFVRHGEDAARAIDTLKHRSVSELFRSVQAKQAESLSALTFATPEVTLDLLLNRILPVQTLNCCGIEGIPALVYMSPLEARRSLLHHARKQITRDEWAHFILLAADYTRITGDISIMEANHPAQNIPLLSCCREALMTLPLDHQGLPQGDDQARRCFLYALAAQTLDKLSPDPHILELSRRLLNAADTYLWNDGHYGATLRLDVQNLACAAYGANPRTRQTMVNCWVSLYDERHGLIRMHAPSDAAPLPGSPENGGMMTLEAVRCLRSLLKTAHRTEAFELLMALNPLHHSDTPERQAVFRCAPYQLHAGMCAEPMQAGRAIPHGGAAAALLYAVILEDILGVQLHGGTLRLNPCVPPDWDDFALTLHWGTSTWHISAERRISIPTFDGENMSDSEIRLTDDGRIHQLRFPLI